MPELLGAHVSLHELSHSSPMTIVIYTHFGKDNKNWICIASESPNFIVTITGKELLGN